MQSSHDRNSMNKPEKYNDADTKKEGSPIETPFKYNDTRRKNFEIQTLEVQVIEEEVGEVKDNV